MSHGYIIEITKPPATEGKPLKEIWYAHIQDKERAIRAVRKAAGARKEVAVDIVRMESHKMLLERLGLLRGRSPARVAVEIPELIHLGIATSSKS